MASPERVSVQLPVRQYELLARLLLDTLETFGEAAEVMARQVGFSFGEKLAGTAVGDELQQRMQPLREAGSRLEARNEGGVVKLELKDCLFREISGSRPGLVCALDRALMEGLLSTDATRYVLGEAHKRCTEDDVCRLTFLAQPAQGAPVDTKGN
jgi:hypothetical protein